MLELRKIVKDYQAGDSVVHALKGVNIRFRENEFVAILGPSGCGKTTLLNIIGGLDQYTSGDLIIKGTTTKGYKDRDWDTYRNHSIGFVFQNYHLIPHQSVLRNVELALTVSGVSSIERKARAVKALEEVGLGDQLNKKPNQISGGQMQRVAIARALANDPDIILADEPTGSLDTEISVQVMEVLKEISKDRLIVMVTHNPELAEKYATRTIRMIDGLITNDSNPIRDGEYHEIKKQNQGTEKLRKTSKKPSMSFGTAFMLSLKNLISKKGRTILTAFAGSIGIMGIALIFAISQGMNSYIDTIQEETLSSYPLTIQKTTTDLSSIIETFMNINSSEPEHGLDAIYKRPAIYDMLTAFSNIESRDNDLKSFKEFLDNERQKEAAEGGLADAVNGVQYSYDLSLLVYTKNVDGDIIQSDIQVLMRKLVSDYFGTNMASIGSLSDDSAFGGMSGLSSLSGSSGLSLGMISMNLWQEMLPGDNGAQVNDLIIGQYDLVYGGWPNNYNEIVLVLDKNNELDDLTLYALGLESKENIDEIMSAAIGGTGLERDDSSWSYEDICNAEFRIILNSECFSYDEQTDTYSDLRDSDTGLRYLYDNALVLKVTGIIRPNENTQTTMLSGSIAYTNALTLYVTEQADQSEIIKHQLENGTTDILTGLPFKENSENLSDATKSEELIAYLKDLDEQGKALAYLKIMSTPTEEQLGAMTEQALVGYGREEIEAALVQAFVQEVGMDEATIRSYFESKSDEEIKELFSAAIAEQVKAQYASQVQEQLSAMDLNQLAGMLDQTLGSYSEEQMAFYYDEVMEFSPSSYKENLLKMGYVDLDSPTAINIYASSFENKEAIEDAIALYNKDVEELSQIKYTDFLGIMMSSVTMIINAITYILLSFVAISLIVSSIMIGVITLISVQERTKEIGILRAIGASKGDVSSMFIAETIIIGFASGLLGVAVTYVLCIPVNMVIHDLTGIMGLNAFLPAMIAGILIALSIVLSLISGVIPSRSAAKKDPVVALRTE